MATGPHWPPERRREALAAYHEFGAAEAGRRCGIPAQTVWRWAKASGTPTLAVDRLAAANAFRAATLAERRSTLAGELLNDAQWLREHLRQADGSPVPDGALRSRSIAMGIAIDKSQLLDGQATTRTERVTAEQVQSMRDELKATGRFQVVK